MKSTEPLISIIVPVYNGEKHVENCAKTLASQTYVNIEIIFINDGSKDKSQDIIKKLAKQDSRIILLTQANSGVSAARNYGIRYAKGEYISFVDVDDFVTKDYIEYLYNLLVRGNADIALVPQAKTFCGPIPMMDEDAEYVVTEQLWTGKKAVAELLLYNIKMSCWCKLFNKKFLKNSQIFFDESLFCGEGFNFNLESFLNTEKIAIGYKTIYYYRIDNSESAMTKFNIELIKNGLQAIDYIERKTLDCYPELQRQVYYAKWHTYCDFYNMIVGCGKRKIYHKEYSDLKQKCKRYSKYALRKDISLKNKCKGVSYRISPYLTARVINGLRPRKFKKEQIFQCGKESLH